jgi:hypothetical protein
MVDMERLLCDVSDNNVNITNWALNDFTGHFEWLGTACKRLRVLRVDEYWRQKRLANNAAAAGQGGGA